MLNAAILLAGGSGSRMRGAVKDKVLENLLGMPVILHSFKAFLDSGCVEEFIFVCRDDAQKKSIATAIKKYFPKLEKGVLIKFADGGKERQDSVLSGLACVSDLSGLAFVHDGARPMLGSENVKRLCETASSDGAAVLASKVTDTIKRVPRADKIRKCKMADLERGRLWAMQTPQVFNAGEILSAYKFIRKNKIKITDDVAALIERGGKVSIVENLYPNPKITVPEDIAMIEFLNLKSTSKKGK